MLSQLFGAPLRRSYITARLLSVLVAAHGIFIITDSLLESISVHHGHHVLSGQTTEYVSLFVGVSLLYIASLLHRRKYTAWLVAVVIYFFYFGANVGPIGTAIMGHHLTIKILIRTLLLPTIVLALLVLYRREFVVRSDRQGFRSALRISVLVLLAAFIYGLVGFSLMDVSDFHEEISLPAAAHYTIDQFGVTTVHQVQPVTKRAELFVNSLSFISFAALLYSAIALFQPLRARLVDSGIGRHRLQQTMARYPGHSDDYFIIWPHDKQYFFASDGSTGLAYGVRRGIAVCLGDPVGDPSLFGNLIRSFQEMCYVNDWQVSYASVGPELSSMYTAAGYQLQSIGREAVVDLNHFVGGVDHNKYFRNIRNRCTKQGYSCELLQPPHASQVLQRLRVISDDWLSQGGRTERGFAMGYFNEVYVQDCPLMVVRDSDGVIQGFLNQLPATSQSVEATYDMLRHNSGGINNLTDFLLMNFAVHLQATGYRYMNLGLCPLSGLDDTTDEQSGAVHNLLKLAFANGDRLYSFSGLLRFKSKYEPEWRERHIAYQGGIRGFIKAITALMLLMRVKD